jgi:hypothetical protein
MEFFIACGDAKEGFKAGKDVFDVMAFHVDAFIEGRFG